jgi:hypothetical protein
MSEIFIYLKITLSLYRSFLDLALYNEYTVKTISALNSMLESQRFSQYLRMKCLYI